MVKGKRFLYLDPQSWEIRGDGELEEKAEVGQREWNGVKHCVLRDVCFSVYMYKVCKEVQW